MLRRTIAFILCILIFIGTLSACKGEDAVDTSSVDNSFNVSEPVVSDQSEPQSSDTQSEVVEQSIYGIWVNKIDITVLVEKFMAREFPESVVVVEPVLVDRVLELYDNKKCVETINAGKVYYDAILKTYTKHVRSLYNDVTAINYRIANFKTKYKKENVTKNMNTKFTGTFTVRGDPKSSGTITFRGEGLDGQKKFTLEGNKMTTVNIVNGKADDTTLRIYEKQSEE